MNLEELHNCEKSHGKIVMIAIDKLGNEYCGYCNQRVDYKGWIIKALESKVQETGDKRT